jgi:RTX calcium-binding nonapeptide repeat (4 copies)
LSSHRPAVVRGLGCALAIGAALLAAPAFAGAATTCTYTAPVKVLDVDLSASGDRADLDVTTVSTEIVVADNGGPITCSGGTPTTNNTDQIAIHNGTITTGNAVAIHNSPRFARASGNEIPLAVNLHGTVASELNVFTDEFAGGDLRFGLDPATGAVQVNTNASADKDADISATGAFISGSGSGGVLDTMSAQGGLGTGDPLTRPISLSGGLGINDLTGGEGDDFLAGDGFDTLHGEGGNDRFVDFGGDDRFDGGAGEDRVIYFHQPAGPLSVDLSVAGPQGTGGQTDSFAGVENVIGNKEDDVLRGDQQTNVLEGALGNDTLEGRGGVDRLLGDDGNDTLDVRDGGPDTAECGPGTDSVTADLPGVDTLIDCEQVLFAQPPTGGGGGPAGSGPAVDVTAPSFVGPVRALPAVFAVNLRGAAARPPASRRRVTRGTTFRFSLSEAARVSFAIERRTRGRRVGKTCRRQTAANRRRRACVRSVRVGAFATQALAGANARRFSGRIGRRRLAPASYRARLLATDVAGNRSKPKLVAFTVARP